MASSNRLLSTLPEVEEPAEWDYRPGLAPIFTGPFCIQGAIRPVGLLGGPASADQSWSVTAMSNGYLSAT